MGVPAALAGLLALSCGAPATSPDRPPGVSRPGVTGAHEDRARVQAQPAQARREHPVFSLVDNRLLAHRQRGGGIVATPGSASFSRYLRFGRDELNWVLGVRRDGRRVALLEGKASIEIPLTPEQAAAYVRVALHLHSPGPGRLTLVAGGTPESAPLRSGWQTVTFPLQKGRLTAGENRLELDAGEGRSLAVEWIQVGGRPERGPMPSSYDEASDQLILRDGEALAYYVHVPTDAHLVAEMTAPPACELVGTVSTHQAHTEVALTGPELRLDLARFAGQVARLELGSPSCPEVRLARAALTVPGDAPPPVARPRKPRNVVFWIMDTLRADRVRPWNPRARAEVPNLQELARTSTVFQNAYVQGNLSITSHASMWTSLFPVNHRLIAAGTGWEWKLADKFHTLGEVARSAGLFNSAVTANGFVIEKAGYAAGFDRFRNLMREHDPNRINGAVPGRKILARAIESLDGHTRSPFLLFMGTIDTHAPWIAHEPWISLYDPGPYDGPFLKHASGGDIGVKRGRMISTDPPAPRDLQRLHALYDVGVSYQDDLVGRLRQQLRDWKVADDTMIVITSDHGEELFEDGRGGHGGSLRETLVHVPLLIHYPPLFPAGVVEEGVDCLDILPTLADALGKPAHPSWQGASLLPLAQGEGRGYPRPSFSSQYEYAHAMRLAGWKMRVGKKGDPDLYDLNEDPLERKNLSSTRPIERRFLTDAFSLFLLQQTRWKKSRWGVASNMTARGARELDR